jgi:hypothetical protein
MKTYFSAVLSLSMAISMVPGTIWAADPKDSSTFSDLKDLDAAVKVKYDEMLKAGIFNGVQEGRFGLKDKMTRAQFAKAASLIFQLKTDESLKISTFPDVTADDPANGYAIPYIEAIYKAGITDGYGEGRFNPGGEVTKEQLAAFLIKGLKLDSKAKPKADLKDDSVSDWAKGYVALAIELKLMMNGPDGKFDGSSPATRDLLVLSTYEARKQHALAQAKPETVTKVSIAKAEAAGAKTITVTLNGAIADTSKLTASVEKGSTKMTSTPKWNDNRNQVTLTLERTMIAGTYSVKLEAVKDSGLTVDKGTADVIAENEKITKIEFITSSDNIAKGENVSVHFKALNQFNEQSDMPATRFDIKVSQDLSINASPSEQFFRMNTTSLDRNDLVFISIMMPDNTAQTNKSFRLGDRQSVSKVELGELKLPGSKKKLEAGDKARLAYKAYDQYGFQVTDLITLRKETNTSVTDAELLVEGSLTENDVKIDKGFGFFEDEDDDDPFPDLVVHAASVNEDSHPTDQEITLSVMARMSGQTATKKIQIASPEVPFEISFDKMGTIAWGDEDAYIPIIVKDQSGKALSIDDIVKFADEIRIQDSGSANVKIGNRIETEGQGKGKIKIDGLRGSDENTRKTGSLAIKVFIDKSDKSASFNTTIGEKRYPSEVYVSSDLKPEMLPSLSAFGTGSSNMLTENKMKLKFKDQYGEDFDKDYAGYEVDLSITPISGTVTNAVYFSKGSLSGTPTWALDTDKTSSKYTDMLSFKGDDTRADGYSAPSTSIKSIRDTDLFLTPIQGDNNEGEYQVMAKLYKSDVNRSLLSTVNRTVKLNNAEKAEDLIYELKPFDNGLYATNESYKEGLEGNPSADLSGLIRPNVTSPVSDIDAMTSWFAGKIEINAKTKIGSSNVALPNNLIRQINGNNGTAIAVAKPKNDSMAFDAYGIRGMEEGITNYSVAFYPSNRSGIRIVNMSNVKVKKDVPTAASFTLGENGKAKTVWLSLLNNLSIHSGDSAVNGSTQKKKTLGDIKIKDQYGATEYKNYSVYRFADLLGTKFMISNTKWTDPANPGVIQIDVDKKAGTAVYKYVPGSGGSQIMSFTVTGVSGGKTQSVDVHTDRTK